MHRDGASSRITTRPRPATDTPMADGIRSGPHPTVQASEGDGCFEEGVGRRRSARDDPAELECVELDRLAIGTGRDRAAGIAGQREHHQLRMAGTPFHRDVTDDLPVDVVDARPPAPSGWRSARGSEELAAGFGVTPIARRRPGGHAPTAADSVASEAAVGCSNIVRVSNAARSVSTTHVGRRDDAPAETNRTDLDGSALPACGSGSVASLSATSAYE